MRDSNDNSDDMNESSYSSYYSSILKTDDSSTEKEYCENTPRNRCEKHQSDSVEMQSDKNVNPRKLWTRPEPPWLENVNVTPDLVYRYQVTERSINDILKEDLIKLTMIKQPILVNEQLEQYYLGLKIDGLSTKFAKVGGLLSDDSSSDDDNEGTEINNRRSKQQVQYASLAMIYEENASFPPPIGF